MYLYDPSTQYDLRMLNHAFQPDADLMLQLQNMINKNNHFAKIFSNAREMAMKNPTAEIVVY